MKKLIIIIPAVLVLIAVLFTFNSKKVDGELFTNYREARYLISGKPVWLGKDGVKYFGNEVSGDLDKDGDLDIAFLITQDGGGSGMFFYLTGAIKEAGGYRGSQAMLIADRIAPQTTELRNGLVIVNYADRKPGEPFTTKPSVGKSIYAKYSAEHNDFGEVVQNFEGESK